LVNNRKKIAENTKAYDMQTAWAVRALLIKVIAPLSAQRVPLLLAALVRPTEVYASIFPFIAVAPPIVADEPTIK
jgi:hypothetical protein